MKTITTRQGDTWDILALNNLGSDMLVNILIAANLKHRNTAIFPAGVDLQIPDIDTDELKASEGLPIWKRGGAA